MGRNKFSQTEINEISRLLALKNAANRAGQKLIRHDLRTKYEFNISDFNEQGKAFGPEELQQAIKRNAIIILDDATIAAMKEKRARDRARDEESVNKNGRGPSQRANQLARSIERMECMGRIPWKNARIKRITYTDALFTPTLCPPP